MWPPHHRKMGSFYPPTSWKTGGHPIRYETSHSNLREPEQWVPHESLIMIRRIAREEMISISFGELECWFCWQGLHKQWFVMILTCRFECLLCLKNQCTPRSIHNNGCFKSCNFLLLIGNKANLPKNDRVVSHKNKKGYLASLYGIS